MIAQRNKGFVLLYSVLITGLLLSIALGIFNIAIKEVILSGSARDSQFAFYAADAGMECALYWDLQHGAFSPAVMTNIDCAGVTIFDVGGREGNANPTEFDLVFDQVPGISEPYCAKVTVVKIAAPIQTIIESRGFNTCDQSNPRRVERALRAKY